MLIECVCFWWQTQGNGPEVKLIVKLTVSTVLVYPTRKEKIKLDCKAGPTAEGQNLLANISVFNTREMY